MTRPSHLPILFILFATVAFCATRSSAAELSPITVDLNFHPHAGLGYREIPPGVHIAELRIMVSAGEIQSAEIDESSGEVIWEEIATTPTKRTFEVDGLEANKSHYLVVSGHFSEPSSGGGGGGGGDNFRIAVNDVDVDVDSDNDNYWKPHRPPNDNTNNEEGDEPEEEDAVESATYNSSSEPPGMRMSVGEDWAMIQVRANVKRQGNHFKLHADNVVDFEFSASPSDADIIAPDADKDVLVESGLTTGQKNWTVYVRPKTTASSGDLLNLTGRIEDPQFSGAVPNADDDAIDLVSVYVNEFVEYGILVEVDDLQGGWFILDPFEDFWEADYLRWSLTDVPIAVQQQVATVEWYYQSAENGAAPWDLFASASGFAPAEGILPVGDWMVKARLLFANGSTSPFVQAEKKFTKGGNVQWSQASLPGPGIRVVWNGTPAEFGGGHKIFPEKRFPGDREQDASWQRDYKIVKVAIFLHKPIEVPGRHVTIWCEILDPDHYSDDPQFDPVGMEEDDAGEDIEIQHNDNFGHAQFVKLVNGQWAAVSNNPNRRDFTFTSETPQVDGQPVIRREVIIAGAQPTDNFQCVGGRTLMLNTLKFDDTGKKPQARPKSGQPLAEIPPKYLTEVLSVFRTLYVEHDRMDSPDFDQAPNPSRIASGNIVAGSVVDNTFKIDTAIAAGNLTQFAFGKITLKNANGGDLGTFSVSLNDTGAEPLITLDGADVPPGAAKFTDLVDDDLEHDVKAADMAVDFSLWQSRLAPAFIQVNTTRADLRLVGNVSVNQSNLPFLLNIGTHGDLDTEGSGSFKEVFGDYVAANRQGAHDPDFWVVYVLGAFQGPPLNDGDRLVQQGDETVLQHTHGVTRVVTGGQFGLQTWLGAMVFRETIRDRTYNDPPQNPDLDMIISENNLVAVTSIHELGHIFGITGENLANGTLMDSKSLIAGGADGIDDLIFSGQGLRTIIEAAIPGE